MRCNLNYIKCSHFNSTGCCFNLRIPQSNQLQSHLYVSTTFQKFPHAPCQSIFSDPSPKQPLIYRSVFPFLELYINGNIQEVLFYAWCFLLRIMSLQSIPAVEWLNTSVLVFPEYYPLYRFAAICLALHLLMSILLVSKLGVNIDKSSVNIWVRVFVLSHRFWTIEFSYCSLLNTSQFSL